MTFFLRVERVNQGCDIAVGSSSPPLLERATVGRGIAVDFRVIDATVSSLHLTIEHNSAGFLITSHSERGTTFINRKALGCGDTISLEADEIWIQIGRVLLALYTSPITIPVTDAMTLPPDETPTAPILTIRQVGLRYDVLCGGHPVALYPSAARVLWRLASSCGHVVSHGDLLEAVDPDLGAGGSNIAQLVTYIRQAFSEALSAGWLSPTQLQAHLRPHLERPPTDERMLLRSLIENVRGVGYRLRLSPMDVYQD